jgi:hypothetical protein
MALKQITMVDITFYTEELESYKTVASKKAFLTRSRKEVVEHLNDVREAIERGTGGVVGIYGLLYGEKVGSTDVYELERELKMIDKLYDELSDKRFEKTVRGTTFVAKSQEELDKMIKDSFKHRILGGAVYTYSYAAYLNTLDGSVEFIEYFNNGEKEKRQQFDSVKDFESYYYNR